MTGAIGNHVQLSFERFVIESISSSDNELFHVWPGTARRGSDICPIPLLWDLSPLDQSLILLLNDPLNRCSALVAFGFEESTVSVEVLQRPDSVFSIGLEPVRIDLLNRIAGISFEEARHKTARGRYGGVDVNFIGRDDLLRNKRATGRARDLGDVEELG